MVRVYKNLQRIETAWNEQRMRGHVFIYMLAYLFEQWMEMLYARYVEARPAETARLADPATRQEEVRRLQSSRLTGRRIARGGTDLRGEAVLRGDHPKSPGSDTC